MATLSLFVFDTSAQDVSGLNRVDIIIEAIPSLADTVILEPAVNPFANDSVSMCLLVEVGGSNITNIHVKVGNAYGGTNYINKHFVFGTEGDLEDGTNLKKRGNAIYLGLGKAFGINEVHAQVWLEGPTGAFSDTLQAAFLP